MKIIIGKDEWIAKSFVKISDTGNTYSFDELSNEDKKIYAEIFNEKALVILGFKRTH